MADDPATAALIGEMNRMLAAVTAQAKAAGPKLRCTHCKSFPDEENGRLKLCGGTCGGSAHYCGPVCAKADWSRHKKVDGCGKLSKADVPAKPSRDLLHALCDAVMEADATQVERLLQQAPELAAARTSRRYEAWPFVTPLHLCCVMGGNRRLACLELLVKQPGMDLDARAGDPHQPPGAFNTRETPLILACTYSPDVALRLLELGARPDLVDWSGHSAKSRATQCLKPGEASVLVAALDRAIARCATSGAGRTADALREEGNAAFREGRLDAAEAKYRASLAQLVDPRTLSNMAAVTMRRAVELGRSIPAALRSANRPEDLARFPLEQLASTLPKIRAERGAWTDANHAASKALEANPSCPKAFYRQARAHMGVRDFPRALLDAREGLQACPGEPALSQLVTALTALGVRDDGCISNVYSPDAARANDMLRDERAPSEPCAFCAAPVPMPLKQWKYTCPFCICDLRVRVPPGAVDELRLA